MKKIAIVLLISAAVAAAPAVAAPITYTLTGNFSDNGLGFGITGIGDTDTVQQLSPFSNLITLTSFRYTDANGGNADFGAGRFGADSSIGAVELYSPQYGGTLLTVQSSSLMGFDGIRSQAFTPVTGVSLVSNGTSFSATNLVFSAVLSNASVAAVPEPAIWSMMILGFGAIGASMRRKQQVRTRYLPLQAA